MMGWPLGIIATVVFAALWLNSQDWFGVLSRRTRWHVGQVCGMVLLLAAGLAPKPSGTA